MEDNTNIQNTAGVAGQNTDTSFKDFVRSIIDEKVEKAYNAAYQVAKSNQEKFGMSDEDVQLAVDNLKADRVKQANAEKEKYAKMVKDLEKANATIAAYETEKKNAAIKQNSISVLNALDIKDQKDITLIQDLAGDKLYACVKEDGSFNEEAAKTLFEGIKEKYGLSFTKKVEQENPYFRLGGKPQNDTQIDTSKMSLRQKLQNNI